MCDCMCHTAEGNLGKYASPPAQELEANLSTRVERYGRRDMLFSNWHGGLDPRYKFLDIDWVWFCHSCSHPLALAEIARDMGRWKPTTVLQDLARLAGLPACCILYQADEYGDKMSGARVRRVYPNPTNFSQKSVSELGDLVAGVHARRCPRCKSFVPVF